MSINFKFSRIFLLLIVVVSCILYACDSPLEDNYKSWSKYLGDNSVSHYSSLQQIDTSNVHQLNVAWEYRSGDADSGSNSKMECNPIIIDGVLYGSTPRLKLFALDAANGKQKWIFDPFADTAKANIRINVNRGVTYWKSGNEKRLFFAAGPYLYAVNAATGKLIDSFGNHGQIDLHDGLGREVKDLFITATSPGIIYNDLLIMGMRVQERGDVPPGHIRAYDVRTGSIKWIFHTIPHPGEFGYETWENKDAWKYIGAANNWAGMSLDQKRGVVYISTGSASFDFYGGLRKGQNLFANCVLALNAGTGKYVWHFQTIHHDMWDRDPPAPPNLVTINRNGKRIDAVAQITKLGFVFILDRDHGKPLFPVDEVPVPDISTLKDEKPWSTQPIPRVPKSFAFHSFTEADVNPFVPDSSQAIIKRRLREIESGNIFLPPSEKGILVFPGLDGGGEWGGAGYDPKTGFLYVNANHSPWILTMMKKDSGNIPSHETVADRGKKVYANNCMSCHGKSREGNGAYPELRNITNKYTAHQILDIVNNGRGMMPSFGQILPNDKKALLAFLVNDKKEGSQAFKDSSMNTDMVQNSSKVPFVPYIPVYQKFRSHDGYPANKPPWGTLTAINLNTAETVWTIPLGEYPELKKKGMPVTGTENYGGPVVTSGGLIFIAATLDQKIRAFNKRTGKLLWEADLPFAGFATPSTYELNGKQYVVIACGGGGGRLNVPSGDSYIAFALP